MRKMGETIFRDPFALVSRCRPWAKTACNAQSVVPPRALARGIESACSHRAGPRLRPRAKVSFAFLCAAFAVCATAVQPASARAYLDRPSSPSSRAEQRPQTHLIASVRSGKSVAAYTRPSGRVLARLGERTPFGSRRTFSVVRKRGRWLQVTDPSLGPNRLGWISVPPGRLRYTHAARD